MAERRTRRLKPSMQAEIEVARAGQPNRKVRWLSRVVSSIFTLWYRWRRGWRR